MKKLLLFTATVTLLSSCGNDVEEIKNPVTGLLEKKYEYYLDDNGQKVMDGEYTEWNSDGSVSIKKSHVDGKLNGEFTYYKSKDVIYFGNHENDKLNGVVRQEDSKGNVIESLTYKNGELNGPSTYNFPNGKLDIQGNYINNLPSGTWKYYDKSGKQLHSLTFNEGVPNELCGIWEIGGQRLSYFILKEDGAVSYLAPWNAYSFEPFEQMSGVYIVGKNLTFNFGNEYSPTVFSYEILSIEKNKIELLDLSSKKNVVLNRSEE